MRNTLIDINAFLGVASLFKKGPRDPWGSQLVGHVVDAFVFSDRIRYPLPTNRGEIEDLGPEASPDFVRKLFAQDANLGMPIPYSTLHKRQVRKAYVAEAFDRFSGWALANRYSLRRWSNVHRLPWIAMLNRREIANTYVFALDEIASAREVSRLCREVDMDRSAVLYAFDAILRYPFYGEMAEDGETYLNHPLRDCFTLPTARRESAETNPLPLSFAPGISKALKGLTEDDFIEFLHHLRVRVREARIHEARPGKFDRDVLRDVLASVGWPAHLRASAAVAGIVGGVIAGLGAIPAMGPVSAVAGGALSVASTFWAKVPLPRRVSRIRWLRWAMEWPEESQAEKRDL